jgi:hypothetical protein
MNESLKMTHDEYHRALVQRLASQVKPSHRLWPVPMRLGLWLALEIGILAWVMRGGWSNFLQRLEQPAYMVEAFFFGCTAVILGVLALRSAIPGRDRRAREAALAAGLALAATILISAVTPMNISYPLNEFIRVGLQCALRIALYGALPLTALSWMVRRGAPFQGGLSGLLVGGSAFSFAFAILRLECPINEPLHVIVWHLLPALALTGVSALAGARWLKFRSRVRRRDAVADQVPSST